MSASSEGLPWFFPSKENSFSVSPPFSCLLLVPVTLQKPLHARFLRNQAPFSQAPRIKGHSLWASRCSSLFVSCWLVFLWLWITRLRSCVPWIVLVWLRRFPSFSRRLVALIRLFCRSRSSLRWLVGFSVRAAVNCSRKVRIPRRGGRWCGRRSPWSLSDSESRCFSSAWLQRPCCLLEPRESSQASNARLHFGRGRVTVG